MKSPSSNLMSPILKSTRIYPVNPNMSQVPGLKSSKIFSPLFPSISFRITSYPKSGLPHHHYLKLSQDPSIFIAVGSWLVSLPPICPLANILTMLSPLHPWENVDLIRLFLSLSPSDRLFNAFGKGQHLSTWYIGWGSAFFLQLLLHKYWPASLGSGNSEIAELNLTENAFYMLLFLFSYYF